MGTGLDLQAISKSFGANLVLDDVSLSVAPGEFVRRIEDHGSDRLAFVDLLAPAAGPAIVRLTAADASDQAIGPGAVAGLALDLPQLHLFDGAGQRLATQVTETASLDGAPHEIPAAVIA